MFEDLEKSSGNVNAEDGFELLQELGRNTTDEVRRQRAHFRVSIKAALWLQPANASDVLKFKVKGVTGDISEGGCSTLFPIPALVGDIYRLTFDKDMIDLPLTFARCLRCRLIKEDAFEVGFLFFRPICLPSNLEHAVDTSMR